MPFESLEAKPDPGKAPRLLDVESVRAVAIEPVHDQEGGAPGRRGIAPRHALTQLRSGATERAPASGVTRHGGNIASAESYSRRRQMSPRTRNPSR